jgi:hypothetical protein
VSEPGAIRAFAVREIVRSKGDFNSIDYRCADRLLKWFWASQRASYWCEEYPTIGEPAPKYTTKEARAFLDIYERNPESRPRRAFGIGPTDHELSLRKIAGVDG